MNEDIEKMEEKGITFPLYRDEGLALSKAYGVADVKNDIAFPATFVVDKEGFIRFAYVGETPKDRPILGSVVTIIKHLSD